VPEHVLGIAGTGQVDLDGGVDRDNVLGVQEGFANAPDRQGRVEDGARRKGIAAAAPAPTASTPRRSRRSILGLTPFFTAHSIT